MSFTEPHFKRLLWLLQSEERSARYSAFEIVKNELREALKAIPFTYQQMMHLLKALYLMLYKEDLQEKQDELSRDIAQLIHECPNLDEMVQMLTGAGEPVGDSEGMSFLQTNEHSDEVVEEEFEPEEEFQDSVNADLQQINDYAGYETLFFRCCLEVFCREFDRVDYLRESKFLLLIRRVFEEMLICGFDSGSIEQMKYFVQTLRMVCLDEGRLTSLLCPRSLVYHIIDIYTDCLHYACKQALPDHDYFAIAVEFWGEVLVALDDEQEIREHILTRIFDDFTEISFYGDEAFANYIRGQDESEEQPTLADCFWIMAVQHPEHKEDLEAFAEQIEEFVDWWKSDESSKYKENKARGLKEEEKEYQEYIKVIQDEAVRIAKQQKGDEWEQYINKQEDEWEYDPKWPSKAMRIEDIYLKGYEKKEDDL